MAKVGRPKIEIDKKQFEKLCALQCTLLEIAGWFNCSDETINNWIKKTYKGQGTFKEVREIFAAEGKIGLRRSQFRLAEKSAAMAIFLGKQYLGQKDDPENDSNVEIIKKLQEIINSVESEANNTKENEDGNNK